MGRRPNTPVDGQVTRLRYLLMGRGPDYLIAGQARIHPTVLSQYANGKKPIPNHHLLSLAAVLQVNPADLIGNVEFKPIDIREHVL